ncbi:flavodoxin domain-containing protein [Lentzea sp. NPDC003310]|uniref:flavodoxin domain-containing protein n=1 Tax=Lentzea sp. NPDC003310 TaxID=3154447 RepID=UPI00339E3393
MTEILVAYATKMGATKEIATRIRSASHEVTLQDAADVKTVQPYKAVVLGSALYAGRWRKEAVRLLTRNEKLLHSRPLWLFHSGPLGSEITPQPAPRKVREIAARLGAEEPFTFGGRLTRETATGFIARKMAQGPMAGDFRDWEEIDRWAYTIGQRLVAAR